MRVCPTCGEQSPNEVAEGNPLSIEQLLAMLAEGSDPEQVPPTMQALLAARLDALPDDERALLERASVVGLEFEWEALGELAPDRRRPSGRILSALVRKELIRPHEAIEDTFRFRHMLIRDAAYERMPKESRAALHERFANWLEGRGEELEEIIGYHLEQAHRRRRSSRTGHRRTRVTIQQARVHLEAMRRNFDGARELIADAESSARELGLGMLLAGEAKGQRSCGGNAPRSRRGTRAQRGSNRFTPVQRVTG